MTNLRFLIDYFPHFVNSRISQAYIFAYLPPSLFREFFASFRMVDFTSFTSFELVDFVKLFRIVSYRFVGFVDSRKTRTFRKTRNIRVTRLFRLIPGLINKFLCFGLFLVLLCHFVS